MGINEQHRKRRREFKNFKRKVLNLFHRTDIIKELFVNCVLLYAKNSAEFQEFASLKKILIIIFCFSFFRFYIHRYCNPLSHRCPLPSAFWPSRKEQNKPYAYFLISLRKIIGANNFRFQLLIISRLFGKLLTSILIDIYMNV